MGTMRPLVKAQNNGSSDNSQEIPVSMDNVRPEGTEDQSITSADGEYLGGMSIWGVPKFKPIWSMMGIIIALSIRIRSYRYWIILNRRSYGCATKTLYETILCSQDIWARILILQRKQRALSGMEDWPCQAFRRAIRRFYSSSFYGLHKVEYW